jgi:hypothetical protein
VVGDLYRELRVTFLKKKTKKTYPKSRLVIQRGNWPIIRQLMSKGPTNASSLCCFKTQQDLGLFSTHAQSSSSVSFDVLFVSSRLVSRRWHLETRAVLSRDALSSMWKIQEHVSSRFLSPARSFVRQAKRPYHSDAEFNQRRIPRSPSKQAHVDAILRPESLRRIQTPRVSIIYVCRHETTS